MIKNNESIWVMLSMHAVFNWLHQTCVIWKIKCLFSWHFQSILLMQRCFAVFQYNNSVSLLCLVIIHRRLNLIRMRQIIISVAYMFPFYFAFIIINMQVDRFLNGKSNAMHEYADRFSSSSLQYEICCSVSESISRWIKCIRHERNTERNSWFESTI